jgi:hypothetical protein
MNKWIHIPTPFWHKRMNERYYIRLEFYIGKGWASRGKYPDGSLKIYKRSIHLEFDFAYCVGKLNYTYLNSEV